MIARQGHTQHYAPGDIDAAIEAALVGLDKDNVPLTLADLAGVDQLHRGGMDATRTLAKLAGITAEERVLDVGGGLGDPA